MAETKGKYTQLTVITNLPPWLLIFVNDCILVTVANLFGKQVYSTQRPADEDENDKASQQAA